MSNGPVSSVDFCEEMEKMRLGLVDDIHSEVDEHL